MRACGSSDTVATVSACPAARSIRIVCGVDPTRLNVSVYAPAGSASNWNRPAGVFAVSVLLVTAELDSTTLTPLISSPPVSMTVPDTDARAAASVTSTSRRSAPAPLVRSTERAWVCRPSPTKRTVYTPGTGRPLRYQEPTSPTLRVRVNTEPVEPTAVTVTPPMPSPAVSVTVPAIDPVEEFKTMRRSSIRWASASSTVTDCGS